MAHAFTVISGAGAAIARAAHQEVEAPPAKSYSVIRLVGAFGFYACLILTAFATVGLRDLNVATQTVMGAAVFGVIWLVGAIEMRLIMLDEAMRKVTEGQGAKA
jgi:hypothetical protein